MWTVVACVFASLVGPSYNAAYSCRLNIAGIRQESVFVFLDARYVRIQLRGIVDFDDIVSYRLTPPNALVYDIPSPLQQRLEVLRTRIRSAIYDARTDVIRLTIKPPLVFPMTLTHSRSESV